MSYPIHEFAHKIPSFCSEVRRRADEIKSFSGIPSFSYKIMLDAIKVVGQVYEFVNDLLCISSIRNDLSHSKQRKFVNQELKESNKLIDIYSTSKDNLNSIKGQLQDLELVLRRGQI
jgi:Arabidopsis protein of unknown function